MRKTVTASLITLSAYLAPAEATAMKWKDYRLSNNVIDVRAETKAVNTQMDLEAGRRYLVAMMKMIEKDAMEHPECATLAQEIEKIKTVRAELEGMENDPVRRLICDDKSADNQVNLCSKIRAKDQASALPVPDLKEFKEELAENYGPAIQQIGRLQETIEKKSKALQDEELQCRATLQLIERKAAEMKSTYNNLLKMIGELSDRQ